MADPNKVLKEHALLMKMAELIRDDVRLVCDEPHSERIEGVPTLVPCEDCAICAIAITLQALGLVEDINQVVVVGDPTP